MELKNGVDFEAHAAGISHQRGSWLACRREILLNLGFHPAKNAEERKVLFVRYSLIFIICQMHYVMIKKFNSLKLLEESPGGFQPGRLRDSQYLRNSTLVT